ncbi:MAG: crossover junction endodeoxyribonuclease RuvC [Nitrospirota bacterium]|nr:MAG: crossover junction endodeoxyribonuclease RuvC [Nitrospirota bacterium]
MRPPAKNSRVIGIDPGSIFCGYGIIDRSGIDDVNYIASGRIALKKSDPLNIRIKELYTDLLDVIKEFKPDTAVIERVFFAKGIKAALNLGHARGIALLAATMENLDVYEYSALEVKKSVAGYGRAEKRQVMSMVSRILGLKTAVSEDSADALALALCHLNSMRIASVIG